jgi:hypothetical protein
VRSTKYNTSCPSTPGSQTDHHLGEDAFLASTLPPAVQRLVRFIGFRCIPPPQPIAIDEDNPSQHLSVIDRRLAVRLREEIVKLAICSSVSQKGSLMSPLRFPSRESRSTLKINAS